MNGDAHGGDHGNPDAKDCAIAENLQIKFRKLYTYLKLLSYEIL